MASERSRGVEIAARKERQKCKCVYQSKKKNPFSTLFQDQLPPSSLAATKQHFPEASSVVPTPVSHMARYI